ncbi:MAG: hypothetical protein Ct9H300mP14_03730 [Gammaproteobacteria bacterium]|nr:MAG: hypothetical protein Ct9H300mP14_03730 [Gammaproteobacteria bacterium]
MGRSIGPRWVYVAESDAKAKEESAAGLVHHIKNFMAKNAAGYLGSVPKKIKVLNLITTSWHRPPCYMAAQTQ